MGTRDGPEKRAREGTSGADILYMVAQSRTRLVDKLQKSHIFRPLASQSPCHDSHDAPNHLHRAPGGPQTHDTTPSPPAWCLGHRGRRARMPRLPSTNSQALPGSSRAPSGLRSPLVVAMDLEGTIIPTPAPPLSHRLTPALQGKMASLLPGTLKISLAKQEGASKS